MAVTWLCASGKNGFLPRAAKFKKPISGGEQERIVKGEVKNRDGEDRRDLRGGGLSFLDGLALLGTGGEAGTGYAFAEAAFFEEILLEAAELLIEEAGRKDELGRMNDEVPG